MARARVVSSMPVAGIRNGEADITPGFMACGSPVTVRSRAEITIEPPLGIASFAFIARLRMASSSWFASADNLGHAQREAGFDLDGWTKRALQQVLSCRG